MLFFDPTLLADLGQFGIKLRSQQHGESCPVEPDHERNRRTQGSIGFVEVCEMPEINAQHVGKQQPATYGKNRTWQGRQETLLNIGSKKVQGFHRQQRESNHNRPMNVWPQKDE